MRQEKQENNQVEASNSYSVEEILRPNSEQAPSCLLGFAQRVNRRRLLAVFAVILTLLVCLCLCWGFRRESRSLNALTYYKKPMWIIRWLVSQNIVHIEVELCKVAWRCWYHSSVLTEWIDEDRFVSVQTSHTRRLLIFVLVIRVWGFGLVARAPACEFAKFGRAICGSRVGDRTAKY